MKPSPIFDEVLAALPTVRAALPDATIRMLPGVGQPCLVSRSVAGEHGETVDVSGPSMTIHAEGHVRTPRETRFLRYSVVEGMRVYLDDGWRDPAAALAELRTAVARYLHAAGWRRFLEGWCCEDGGGRGEHGACGAQWYRDQQVLAALGVEDPPCPGIDPIGGPDP